MKRRKVRREEGEKDRKDGMEQDREREGETCHSESCVAFSCLISFVSQSETNSHSLTF